jgi:hypothetical protein
VRKSKAESYGWYAAAFTLLGVALFVPAGRYAPWLGPDFDAFPFVMPGLILIPVGIYYVALALVKRRASAVALVGLGLAGALGFHSFWPPSVEASWLAKFEHELPRLTAACDWLGKQKIAKDGEQVLLLADLQSLSRFGKANVYKDAKGRVWFTFATATYGIDNSRGFSWSPSGLPPPREAWYDITHSEALRDGWYMFWST